MTIKKSILVTLFIIISMLLFGFLIAFISLGFSNVANNLIGLLEILSYIIIYTLLLLYFKISKEEYSLEIGEGVKMHGIVILFLLVIALGRYLFDLPFFEWRTLSNSYFETTFTLRDYSQNRLNEMFYYRAFSILVLAPFFEELIFRYYIFGGLLKKYNFKTAIITSSSLFAIIHFDSIQNIIPAFVLGVISSIIYYKTNNINYSILFHFISNSFWFLTIFFFEQYGKMIDKIGTGLLFWTIFVSGILICLWGMKKTPSVNTTNNNC